MRVEPIFKPGDYITNRTSGDLAIVDKVTPKNYYRFKAYYGNMFHELKDVKRRDSEIYPFFCYVFWFGKSIYSKLRN